MLQRIDTKRKYGRQPIRTNIIELKASAECQQVRLIFMFCPDARLQNKRRLTYLIFVSDSKGEAVSLQLPTLPELALNNPAFYRHTISDSRIASEGAYNL